MFNLREKTVLLIKYFVLQGGARGYIPIEQQVFKSG